MGNSPSIDVDVHYQVGDTETKNSCKRNPKHVTSCVMVTLEIFISKNFLDFESENGDI